MSKPEEAIAIAQKMLTTVEVLKKLQDSFPKTAPYSKDPLKFARNYIEAMQSWATDNLGVNFDE
jgi:hypothetical protein